MLCYLYRQYVIRTFVVGDEAWIAVTPLNGSFALPIWSCERAPLPDSREIREVATWVVRQLGVTSDPAELNRRSYVFPAGWHHWWGVPGRVRGIVLDDSYRGAVVKAVAELAELGMGDADEPILVVIAPTSGGER
jgi:hypothetical protein